MTSGNATALQEITFFRREGTPRVADSHALVRSSLAALGAEIEGFEVGAKGKIWVLRNFSPRNPIGGNFCTDTTLGEYYLQNLSCFGNKYIS